MTPKQKQDSCGYVEGCKSIFVSWQWALGIIITWVVLVGSVSYVLSARLTTFEMTQDAMQEDVDKLKMIDTKIDILIKRTNK